MSKDSNVDAAEIFNDPLADLGLETNVEPGPKKKKDDKAYITKPDLEQACIDLIKARQQKKDAEARIARAEAKIIPVAEEARLNESTMRGENISTVAVNETVRVSTPDRYSAIPKEHVGQISKTLGNDTNKYIDVETIIELKPEIAADKDALKNLIETLGGGSSSECLAEGKKKLAKLFNINQVYNVKSAFHNDYATSKEFREKAQPLMDNGLVKRTKSSVLPM